MKKIIFAGCFFLLVSANAYSQKGHGRGKAIHIRKYIKKNKNYKDKKVTISFPVLIIRTRETV